jgi:ubiquinone/menaquinone biosynthesis C-methylase UbiE
MAESGIPLNQLVLLDSSSAMLEYSRQWERQGAKLVVADARETSFRDASFDIIVSSLGDPYNCSSFWFEVTRLLRPRGICLFTCPAFEWACRFREEEDFQYAEFVVKGNKIVKVPSYVPALEKQIKMISRAGLIVREITAFSRTDLRHGVSPKLDVFDGRTHSVVVRGFAAQRLT